MRRLLIVAVATAAVAVSCPQSGFAAQGPAPTQLPHGAVDRVDLGPGDIQADAGIVDRPSISADGRYVAFASMARNLGAGGHGQSQVLVRDRLARKTILVSATPSGAPGARASSGPAISADGRYVAFESYAADLTSRPVVPGVQNVYVRDLRNGRTTLLSAAAGRGADDDSSSLSISATGDRIAFDSRADNLVGGAQQHRSEVYVWDRSGGAVRRESVDVSGAALPSSSGAPSLSEDGNRVAFIQTGTRGGTCSDVYVKDLVTGVLLPASVGVDSSGGCGQVQDVTMDGDGRHVAFATNWPLSPDDHDFTMDVYVRDLLAGTTTLVSKRGLPGTADERGASYGPSLSRDGRWVAFTSFADDLGADHVPRNDSAYLKDLTTGAVSMVASAAGRPLPAGSSFGVAISPDAAHLVFASTAQNLVPADSSHAADVFVVDRSGAQYAAAATPVAAPIVAPHTEIDIGPAGIVTAGLQKFVLRSDTAGTWFQCKFDSGRWHRCGSTVTWRVGPGRHQLWARAIDAAGNIDPSPASRVFQVR